MRPSVELTTQTFDPAFGIGKLSFEIVYLLLTVGFALTELQKLVNTIYGYMGGCALSIREIPLKKRKARTSF